MNILLVIYFMESFKFSPSRDHAQGLQTQQSMKFIMLINIKMPTIVGILTFISIIYATSESLKVRKVFIFQNFSFYEQVNFHAPLS